MEIVSDREFCCILPADDATLKWRHCKSAVSLVGQEYNKSHEWNFAFLSVSLSIYSTIGHWWTYESLLCGEKSSTGFLQFTCLLNVDEYIQGTNVPYKKWCNCTLVVLFIFKTTFLLNKDKYDFFYSGNTGLSLL